MFASLTLLAACALSAPTPDSKLTLGKALLGGAAIVGTSVAISEGVKKRRYKDELEIQRYLNQQQSGFINEQNQQLPLHGAPLPFVPPTNPYVPPATSYIPPGAAYLPPVPIHRTY